MRCAQHAITPNGLSGHELAIQLGVAPSTLNRVLNGASSVSLEMALRLPLDLAGVQRIEFKAA